MVSRFGARLLTGSAAFLIGGLLDLAIVAWGALRRRRHARAA
jgi:hypothetical protein